MGKLDARAFGLALAIFWGSSVLLMGFLAVVCSWAMPFVKFLAVMYRGYAANFIGSLIGGIWGFVDGFICGIIFAWLYNNLLKKS